MMLRIGQQQRAFACVRQSLKRSHRWKSSVAAVASPESFFDEEVEGATTPLINLRSAKLGYPGDGTKSVACDLTIYPPNLGGHALLGRNGMGKSLIGQTIVSRGSEDYLKEGEFATAPKWHSRAIAHVSFDSHQELLEQGGRTAKAIGEGGNLTKAAQFLVVRFGLFPLLQREVRTLSTGEIRKVLLVRALSNRPKLLILDNAFDGLDVASREILKDLVQKTISGFTQDILVQGVSSQATAHTQVLMTTHRPEELVDALEVVSWFDSDGDLQTERRNGRSGLELLQHALDAENDNSWAALDWDDPKLPSKDTVEQWWVKDRDSTDPGRPLVSAEDVSIERGETTLLHNLSWTVMAGERWLIGGGNGAGKSTLSRLLARPEGGIKGLHIQPESVGWVSTEKHMESALSTEIVRDMLESNSKSPQVADAVADWLGIIDYLDRPFTHLSQGQQKMALIAQAVVGRPKLLVLDEPCQGLDGMNRHLLLTMMERICQSTDMSLVYITHHMEELLPSMTHALHLKERRDAFNGTIDSYDPSVL